MSTDTQVNRFSLNGKLEIKTESHIGMLAVYSSFPKESHHKGHQARIDINLVMVD